MDSIVGKIRAAKVNSYQSHRLAHSDRPNSFKTCFDSRPIGEADLERLIERLRPLVEAGLEPLVIVLLHDSNYAEYLKLEEEKNRAQDVPEVKPAVVDREDLPGSDVAEFGKIDPVDQTTQGLKSI